MSTATGTGLSAPRRRAALATLCTVLFLTFLDTTVVSVALADVQQELHAGVSALQWVVNGYALVFASLMLAGGALGDRFGRKRVMLGGVAMFCAGSVVAALAPSTGVLIAGRVVMGFGAAASEPGTLSVIRQLYPDRRGRARALGGWSAVSGLALALGPVIGGAIVGFAGWRGVFWFNFAFGLCALVAAAATVPESADPSGRRLDRWGLVLGVAALVAGVYAVIDGEQRGYTTWWIVALLAFAVVAGAGFVLVESRVDDPLMDPAYFRNSTYAGANAAAFGTFFGVFALFFFVALYVRIIVGQTSYEVALEFLPMAAAMIVTSALTGFWVARAGPRLPMALGCGLGAAGILLTEVVLGPQVSVSSLAGTMALAGVGFGMALVPVTSAALNAVPAQRSGMAASTTNTSRELGAVFGVAVLGALVNAQLGTQLRGRLHQLGIPAQFQSIVVNAVEHGGLPSSGSAVNNPAAAAHASLVQQVIQAAYAAFSAGLTIALLVSGAILLAVGILAFLVVRGTPTPSASAAGGRGEQEFTGDGRP